MSDNTFLTSGLEIFPRDVNPTEFTHAYDLHHAVCALRLEQNRQTKIFHPTLSDEMLAQRAALLDVPIRMLLNARDKTLDTFCADWLKRQR